MKPYLQAFQHPVSLLLSILVTRSSAQQLQSQYTLLDDYSPTTFTNQFSFFTAQDPTNGFVNYISSSAASSSGLFGTTQSSVHLGVDSNNIVPSTSRGRDSVRVESIKSYNAGSLFVLDATHMPQGCGTWPAFWLYGPQWPVNGEIDIIEGVNSQAANSFAAHTGPGCSISASSTSTGQQAFLGQLSTSNCDVNAPGQATNAGCGIQSAQGAASYGAGFNANGGGVYATEWTTEAISIWFFPRGSIPSDITAGVAPNPAGWGTPQARFGTPSCDVDQHFKDQRIVINTALCGDWAGGVWGQDSVCAAQATTCEDFVRNNPAAFRDAYWEISSLKVYQSSSGGGGTATATATTTGSLLSTSTAASATAVPSTFSTVLVTSAEASSTASVATTATFVGDTTTSLVTPLTTSQSVAATIQTSQFPTTTIPISVTTTPQSAAQTSAPYVPPPQESTAQGGGAWTGWGGGQASGGSGRPAWAGSGYGGRGGGWGGRGSGFGPP